MSKTTTTNLQGKLGRRALGVTMITQMVALALVPLAIIGVAVIVTLSASIANTEAGFVAARTEVAEKLEHEVQGAASVTVQGITNNIGEQYKDLLEWAALPAVRQAAKDAAVRAEELGLPALTVEQIEAQMEETKALSDDPVLADFLADVTVRNPDFADMSFTDAHGYNVAHSNMPSDFVQADEEWWNNAWTTGGHLGQIKFHDSIGVYAMEFCVRIDDVDGTPLGVLRSVVSVQAIQPLISNAAGLTKGSTVRFLTPEGDQIADSSTDHDPSMIMTEKGNVVSRGWQAAEQILQGDSTLGYLAGQQDLDGQQVVIGYASLGGHERFEELGWTVLVTQPEDVAFAVLEGLDKQVEDLRSVRSTVIALVVVISGITIAAAVALAILAARRISQPIARLAGISQRLAGGDFDAEVVVDQLNEVGQLQNAFGRMAGRLHDILDSERSQREHMEKTVAQYMEFVGDIAAGDLTTRLPTNGSNGSDDPLIVLGHNLNEMVDNLREMTVRTKEAATALSSQSAEILATTTQQASGATEQSAAISQATTTVDEIKTIAEQSVSRSQTVADMTRRTVEVSRTGQELVQQTISGMSQIKTRVDVIEENILALSERTNQIGEIIDTVNQIASQSNMLALNAAVEAARAGEQGKGFAVVAEEVRDLAERSTQATAQVKAILSDIQKATNATGMATEEGKKGVDAGVQLVGQMGEAIAQLAQVIDESTQSAAQMVAGGRQQTSGMEQIALAMQNISQVTVQSMASTRQAEKSAKELNELAMSLTGTVEQYQL